jgi:hypothetical protein
MQSSSSGRRISQGATIFDRVVSRVTITDPRHFLFGHRLAVLDERSGRGPSYVVVELADGRKRSVRIAATDLVPPGNLSSAAEPSLPCISVRTLIPLARHLNRILTLRRCHVVEATWRDESAVRNFKRPRRPRATWSSPRRVARGAIELI